MEGGLLHRHHNPGKVTTIPIISDKWCLSPMWEPYCQPIESPVRQDHTGVVISGKRIVYYIEMK